MTRTRTSQSEFSAAAIDGVVAALEAADIHVDDPVAYEVPSDQGYDAVLHLMVDDRPLIVPLEVVSYCTGQRALELLARFHPTSTGTLPLVVADKITAEGRATLTEAGWSWFDRRGRLHLRGPAIRVDVDVPRKDSTAAAGTPGPPIAGRGGITVAYWLCAHPGEALSPTRSASELGLAPSTISTSVRNLSDAGLVGDDRSGLFPELFWELAGSWKSDRTWLATAPDPKLHVTSDRRAPTWRRTGAVAAAAYGAPVVTSEAGPIELYVPGTVAVSVALRRYGAAEPGTGAAVLAVAPAAPVAAGPGDDQVPFIDGWPAAPVLAVALDLAQDRARGREILADWRTDDAVWL